MKITRKDTSCPLCFGAIVIDDGKVTCIEGHNLDGVEFNAETMKKLQPLIDWQIQQGYAPVGDSHK